MAQVVVQAEELKELVIHKLTAANLQEDHAKVVADVLVHADLRGVHSHGVLRTEHYIKRLSEGGIKPNNSFKVESKGRAGALFDGDHGMGHVITKEAMDHAISLSKENGIGMVGIINSSHCGALSYFAEHAANQNTVSMIVTQTDRAVVPFGGAESYFGTNPLAYGFPAKKHRPIILDMATSNVALGKVLHAREKGQSIPENWGVDQEGVPVTDPSQVKSLLPVGGPKGYGLALMVDVLSGVLTGSAFGPSITTMYGDYNKYRKLGHMIITIDPGLFINTDEFLTGIDSMIDELHELEPAKNFNKVLVPGEPEQLKEEEYLKNGIPVEQSIFNFLNQ
ncbi:ureidoglycolate dehydrogenase [Alteribacillus bidgolensis]|uniref:Ureidoglycolate dehydrogenase (NAD+) n=1 Tax=Alteribacillus bidgolensis TaxID=930129 RepID=A0A1G8EAN6_9BACI|nr:ureidoglycolate dehydrogenase [Alteribacillus bidgolensis]SDH67002.1 ureidoglycolate dehydrogenase (NAD+) [Alteribacillus bidgolensis]